MIGKKIKKRRLELGLTQTQLALKVGYKSKTSITKIESNVNDVPRDTLLKFAEALDVPLEYLMDIDVDYDKVEREAWSLNALQNDVMELVRRLNDDEIKELKNFINFILSKRGE